MKNIMLLAFLASTIFLEAQNIPVPSSFHFKNPNSILPGRIFGNERETGHLIKDPKLVHNDLRTAGLFSVKVIDSLLFWEWDTSSNSWLNFQKISDITYNDVNLPKTYTVYSWKGEWEPDYRYVIAFDENNNIVNEVEQTWDGSDWNNSYRYIYVFDENNNVLNESTQRWEENDWENRILYSFTYDVHNNNTAGLTQRYDGTNWTNESYYSITYDANQNQLSYTLQEWDNSEWFNTGQYLYTYDANKNNISNIYQHWNGSTWENVIKYTFTFDAANLLTSELSQYWVDGVWDDYARFSFTYNGDQLINQLVEVWNETEWINSVYYTYTYDAGAHEASEIREVWNGINWINSEESSFEYQDEILKSEAYKYYDESGTTIVYGDSARYYFHEITGIQSPDDKISDLFIYPNPASNLVYLICENEHAIIYISDFTGRPLLTQPIMKGINSIDCQHLPAGAYLVRMEANELSTPLVTRLMIAK